jgi:addiction module HigA family antidote
VEIMQPNRLVARHPEDQKAGLRANETELGAETRPNDAGANLAIGSTAGGGEGLARRRSAAERNVKRVRTHPGEMLREEFMKPLGLSANKLAMELRIPATRVGEIVNERRGVTADTALRLARYLAPRKTRLDRGAFSSSKYLAIATAAYAQIVTTNRVTPQRYWVMKCA